MTDQAAPRRALRVTIIAGEPSGDALGDGLMRALRQLLHEGVDFSGIGGERMQAEGLKSWFPIDDLSVMGLVEVLPRARRILRRIDETVKRIKASPPDLLITIDSPGFTHRVIRRLGTQRSFPVVHYVAPTVWAWKPGRAKKLAKLVDHLLVLLPFEPPHFEAQGLHTTFVGHPAVETLAAAREREQGAARGLGFRKRYDIPEKARLVAVLPGSRRGEVGKLWPIFAAALERLKGDHPNLHIVIPTVPGVAGMVVSASHGLPFPATVVQAAEERYEAMVAAEVALAASGTATLELGLAETPTVLAYRVNPLTAAIVRRMIKTPFAGLVNILLGRAVMPEFLQENCKPLQIAAALAKLLDSPSARQEQVAASRDVAAKLGAGEGTPPSQRAAKAALKALLDWQNRRTALSQTARNS